MGKKKFRFPAYASVIGQGSEITGTLVFSGGLHVDGRVVGDVIGENGNRKSQSSSALTLSETGVIEGSLKVPHVVIDGTVIGDVRAERSAVLAAGARIQGTVFYGTLEMDEGAAVNGKLVQIAEKDDSEAVGALPAPEEASGAETGVSSTEGADSEARSAPDP